MVFLLIIYLQLWTLVTCFTTFFTHQKMSAKITIVAFNCEICGEQQFLPPGHLKQSHTDFCHFDKQLKEASNDEQKELIKSNFLYKIAQKKGTITECSKYLQSTGGANQYASPQPNWNIPWKWWPIPKERKDQHQWTWPANHNPEMCKKTSSQRGIHK